MIKDIASIYKFKYPEVIVYMLQATEYDLPSFFDWFYRTKNFGSVMHRKSLVMTKKAKLLLLIMKLGILIQLAVGIYLAYISQYLHHSLIGVLAAGIFLLSSPIVWGHIIVLPLILSNWLILKPYYWFAIKKSKKVFAEHKATKIAIAGSYGKTTMKEILLTVLSEGKKIAATPANRNVSISHAQFAKSLKGDEEVLIIEYGEGQPGDVSRFAKNTHPDIGVITGVAPAHLDKYKTLKAAAEDIFSLQKFVKANQLYVNAESKDAHGYIKKDFIKFSTEGIGDWKISNVRISADGTTFTMAKPDLEIKLETPLIGGHLVGPIGLAVYLGYEFGLNKEQIVEGVKKLKPFEHRMSPRQLRGAWIIDDTYNGNIEGMLAGLKLLTDFPSKNKIYVTPGLVDQGPETLKVHTELGQAIAKANPDLVVLMQNSVCKYIEEGLKAGGYKGKLRIEDDPLEFYTNLEHFVASGDLVLMQNDWPDNYA